MRHEDSAPHTGTRKSDPMDKVRPSSDPTNIKKKNQKRHIMKLLSNVFNIILKKLLTTKNNRNEISEGHSVPDTSEIRQIN